MLANRMLHFFLIKCHFSRNQNFGKITKPGNVTPAFLDLVHSQHLQLDLQDLDNLKRHTRKQRGRKQHVDVSDFCEFDSPLRATQWWQTCDRIKQQLVCKSTHAEHTCTSRSSISSSSTVSVRLKTFFLLQFP